MFCLLSPAAEYYGVRGESCCFDINAFRRKAATDEETHSGTTFGPQFFRITPAALEVYFDLSTSVSGPITTTKKLALKMI